MEYIFIKTCHKMRTGRQKRFPKQDLRSKLDEKRRIRSLKGIRKQGKGHTKTSFSHSFNSRKMLLPALGIFACGVSVVVLFTIFIITQVISDPCSTDSQCTSENPCHVPICRDGFCDVNIIDKCCIRDSDCSQEECFTNFCVNGTCQSDMKANESYCDDSDLCTIYDKCMDGVCNGVELTCQLNNECRRGECVEGVGCIYTSVENGVMCDDLNLCTIDDICWNGMCLGTPRNCSSFDSQCSLGVCDALTGNCRGAPIKQMEACSDGLYCTVGDQCLNGLCEPGSVNPCKNEATCNEAFDDFQCDCVSGYTGKTCEGIVKAQVTQAIVVSGFSLTDIKQNPVVQDSIQESIALSAGVEKSQVEILGVDVAPSTRRRLLSSTSGVNVDYRITLSQTQNLTEVKETLETLKNDTSVQEQLMDTVKDVILEKRDANPTLVYFNPILFDPVELTNTLETIQITTVIEPEELCPIGSGFRNGICFECESDEYNNEATTNTSSVCKNRTLCAPGFKSLYTPSTYENNICVECENNTFRGEPNENTSCIEATTCGAGLEVDVFTDKIIDTTCRLCRVGYESNDDGPCERISICAGLTCFDNNPCTVDACVEEIGCMIQHRDYNSTCIPGCHRDVDCPFEYICYDGTCIKMSTSVTEMQIRYIGHHVSRCPVKLTDNFTWVENVSAVSTCIPASLAQCQQYAIQNRTEFWTIHSPTAPAGCFAYEKYINFNEHPNATYTVGSPNNYLCNFPFDSGLVQNRLHMNFVLDSQKYVLGNDTRYRVILDESQIQMDSSQPLGFGNEIFNLNYNDFGYNVARTAFTVSTECQVINASNCRFVFSNRVYRFAAKVHDCIDISSVPAKHCIDPQHYVWSNIYASVEDCTDFPDMAHIIYPRNEGKLIYKNTDYIGYKNASDYLNITNDNTKGIVGIYLPHLPMDVFAVITDLKICKGSTIHHLGGCVDGTNHSECYNTGCFNWVFNPDDHSNYPLNFEMDIMKNGALTSMAMSDAFSVNGCYPNDEYNATDATKCKWHRCETRNNNWRMTDGFEFNFKPLFKTRYYDNDRLVFDIRYRYTFCENGTVSGAKYSQIIRHQIH